MSGDLHYWKRYRAAAERIGEAIRIELQKAAGTDAKLHRIADCDPGAMVERCHFPLLAYVVTYASPLQDVAIFFTSLKEDAARPLVANAAHALLTASGAAGDAEHPFEIADAVEFEDAATAAEQCDALFQEASFSIEMSIGEMKVVLGTDLLEAASRTMEGVTLDEAAGSAPMPSIDALDAELAAQERAAAGAVPRRTSAAASAAPSPESTMRWTQLLSGVEVELVAEIGQAHLSLNDITSLAPERVLTLEQLVEEPVSVLVNGMRYATARLVVVEDEYGIEILEIIDPSILASTLAA